MAARDRWIPEISVLRIDMVQQASYDDLFVVLLFMLASAAYISTTSFWQVSDPYLHMLYEKPQQRVSSSAKIERIENLEQRMEKEGCDVAILWASQSGTAERFSGRLAKDLQNRFGVRPLTIDVSDINPSSLADVGWSRIIILLASTFGEGDPSDNLHQMWSWLCSETKVSLSNLRFMAFGLGNSNYKYYNKVVDVIETSLLARGAQMLLPTGKADDACGETEEHFLEWKQKVLGLFEGFLGYSPQPAVYEPSILVTEKPDTIASDLWTGTPQMTKKAFTQSKIGLLPVVQSQNLLKDSHDRFCLHLDIDISEQAALKYKTGDHLVVWAVNPDQEVDILLRTMGMEAKKDTAIHVESLTSSPSGFPSPSTLKTILQSYLEICAPPPRDSIDSFLPYAPTSEARAFLQSIANYKASYTDYMQRHHLTLGRLLQVACPQPGAWSAVPLSLILESLQPLRPRYYSIASSSVVKPQQISIVVGGSDASTKESPDRVLGLTSNYLLSNGGLVHQRKLEYTQAIPSGQIYAAVRRSNFRPPMSTSSPMIMIAAGTGVGPFRAFAQERARLKSMGREVGTTWLFFGCRNPAQDFLYVDDFTECQKVLADSFKLTSAFSRPNNPAAKRYVQDAVRENAIEVCKLLAVDKAYLYICGSSNMARGVSAAITDIIESEMQWCRKEVDAFIDRQKRQRRWLQDVWG